MKKGPDGPEYWSYEKVAETDPKFKENVFWGSPFYTFSVYAPVWPQMGKLLKPEYSPVQSSTFQRFQINSIIRQTTIFGEVLDWAAGVGVD